jgi:hypothetical protein
VETRVEYERRLGARSEIELEVPFNVHDAFGRWQRGLGDIEVGVSHVVLHRPRAGAIVAAGAAMTFPTGKETLGLGNRLTVFEPAALYSQVLPADAFLHAQFGADVPLNLPASDEIYWRAAVGKTLTEGRWGRAWSPMIELLAMRELEFAAPVRWEVVPQLQITLSRRQHISVNGGVRVPLNLPRSRASGVFYLLWDWVDGGAFDGWR